MALGIVNELHAVSGGEVDPYRYFRVSTLIRGKDVLVAHVVPNAERSRGNSNPELWVLTYEGFPYNDTVKTGDESDLKFTAASMGSEVSLDELLKEKFGAYDSTKPEHRYTHVAYPVLNEFVVHDGWK